MNVTLRQLRAFVTVAQSGNFTRASERLHIAQSAVSALVQELEAQLGIRLFDRTTRKVELTEAGREFRVSAEKVIADLEDAVRSTHDLVARKRGRIVVAAPPLPAATLLPAAIAEFNRSFPGIQVALVETQTKHIAARVKAGEVDIGIGTFWSTEEGLTRTLLARDVLALFCSVRHALAKRRRIRWRELKDQPLITLTHDSAIRGLVEFGYQAVNLTAQPAYEVTQMGTVLALVEAGLGVAALPRYSTAMSNSRTIAIRPLAEPVVPQEIVAVSRSERSLPPAAMDFLEHLRNRMTAIRNGRQRTAR